MAVYDTYTATGKSMAEDVQDVIYNISPVDSPVCSMSRTISASGKLHEWNHDKIEARGENAQAEGADAPTETATATTAVSNWCQIFSTTAKIAGTLEAVDKYGRDSEMAHQLEKKYAKLANDEEWTVVGTPASTNTVRQTGAAGSAGTARKLKPIYQQMAGQATVYYATDEGTTGGTARGLFSEVESDMLVAQELSYSLGGNPGYLIISPAQALTIANFGRSAGRTRDIRNESRIVNVIDLYVSPYGELDVVLDRNCDPTAFLMLDFEYLATPVLRSTDDWPLARDGDYEKRQVLRESTFAVLNPDAHAVLDEVPAFSALAVA